MALQDAFDAALGIDEDFLPDGWDGESDIFTEAGELNADAFVSDAAQEEPTELTGENENGADEAEALTMGDEAEEADQSAEDETEDTEPDGAEQTEVKTSRKLTLKVNHGIEELDINSMSDEDLIALLQKGRAFDAMKSSEAKAKFRATYDAQLEAGMTEDVARLVAKEAAGGTYSLNDEDEAEQEDQSAEQENTYAPVRDYAAEVTQLKALFPSVGEIPDEVLNVAATQDIPVVTAYLAYRDRENAKAAASLKKENAILKQNAASAAKAPVKGVTGGGVSPDKVDYFIEGFDSDPW